LENQNILETPILTPKQPQIVDYPPFDSQMLISPQNTSIKIK